MSPRSQLSSRQVPVGAEPDPDGGVHFRVWAPRRRQVEVVFPAGRAARRLVAEGDGYFALHVDDARPARCTRFAWTTTRRPTRIPPRASSPKARMAPRKSSIRGVRVERRRLARCHAQGAGALRAARRHVHAGGTWAAAAARLEHLRDVGVTCIEMMPVAEFPGRFGWGYDGVDLFAPTRLYGTPDDLRALRRSRARARPRRHPRRRLQPPRTRRATTWAVLRRRTSARRTRPSGAPRSTSTATTPGRSASSSSRTRRTGSASSTSTGCGSTPRSRSSTRRPSTSWRRWRAPREAAGGPLDHPRRRERAAARADGAPADAGGCGLDALWNDDFHHSAVVAADRPARGVLHRLRGLAAGVHLGRQVGLPVPGSAVPVAGAAARHGRPRPLAGAVRQLLREPRPGGEHRPRAAAVAGHHPGSVPRALGARAAVAGDADAVPGTGVRLLEALPLFRRPQSRTVGARHDGPRGVPRAVPEHQRPVHARAARAAIRRGYVRAVPARLERVRDARRRPSRSTATCCGCGDRSGSFAAQARPASTAQCSGPRRSCLRFFDGEPGSAVGTSAVRRGVWRPAAARQSRT
jgi:hypothetical protein